MRFDEGWVYTGVSRAIENSSLVPISWGSRDCYSLDIADSC